jgi:hypothetical protein
MKKVLLQSLFLALIAISLTFGACKKDSNTTFSADDIVQADANSQDLGNAESLTQTAEDESDISIQANMTSCPAVSFAAPRGTFPNTITIDYGIVGCAGPSGRIRKGKVFITYSDSFTRPNATKTITFLNFYIDSVKVEGAKSWTNNGLNPSGQPSFTRTVVNGKLTYPDATSAIWNSTHTVTQTEGFNTLSLLDNVYTVIGSESGTNRNGKTFSATITSPIVHKVNCPYITSGVRSITFNSRTISLDYGYSPLGRNDCDRFAQLTMPNGTTRVILIR